MLNTVANKTECACNSTGMACDLYCSKCAEDLAAHLWKKLGERINNIDIDAFVNHMMEHNVGPIGTCAICGESYVYGGNNPSPVVKDKGARCCVVCYHEVVVPALTEAAHTPLIKDAKKAPMMELSPKDIVKYVHETGSVKVLPAVKDLEALDEAAFNIIGADYNAPLITFKRSDSEEDVSIDWSKVEWSLMRGGDIAICVRGEHSSWRLYANYDIEPRKIKDRLLRAAEIEAYINNDLGITKDSEAMVHVRLRSDQPLDDNGLLLDTSSHHYEMILGSSDEEYVYTYVDGIFLPLDAYEGCLRPQMIKDFTRGLIYNLLTASQHGDLKDQVYNKPSSGRVIIAGCSRIAIPKRLQRSVSR